MKIKEILVINESASVGATSSGAIAVVSVPLGSYGFNPADQWRSIYYNKNKKRKNNRKKIKNIFKR